jgi:hypothetical protein
MTSKAPETPHESAFVRKYGSFIQNVMLKLKNPKEPGMWTFDVTIGIVVFIWTNVARVLASKYRKTPRDLEFAYSTPK